MLKEWSLRQEVLATTHRWPVILLFILAGGLIGWGLAYIWPSPHQATTEIYVAINPYQALTDRNAAEHATLPFNYADDYKNWQMDNLNALTHMSDVLQETLNSLRKTDDAWNNVSVKQLADMLDAYWRNAGKWRLVAQDRNSKRASQAVTAWRQVVLEKTQAAVAQAQTTMNLDSQIRANSAALTAVQERLGVLKQLRTLLQGRRLVASQWSPDAKIGANERSLLLNPLQGTDLGPDAKPVLDAFPAEGSPAKVYLAWLDLLLPQVDANLQKTEGMQAGLAQKQDALNQQYAVAAQASLGFSPNLVVQEVNNLPPQMTTVRPTGTLAFLGSIFGLIIWMIYWLMDLTRRSRQVAA